MKEFFNEDLLLNSQAAKTIYHAVKDLPIIDYHCHLDQNKIAEDAQFSDIGDLWLSGDHYKWRAMRLCGVDESYITGKASYHDKFIKYAEILPQLIGNPLYYWTHLELKQIFGIVTPLNASTAEAIYTKANMFLKNMTVRKLLKKFKVEFIATTDDPIDALDKHGAYDGITVTPTFRPDKLYALSEDYFKKLGVSAGMAVNDFDGLLMALQIRLDYFVNKGCRMADHGFDEFPKDYATLPEARDIFYRRDHATKEELDRFFGFSLVWLAKQYQKRNMTMQIHFAVTRNVNPQMFACIGADSGFDVISEQTELNSIRKFLQQLPDSERPLTVLYPLNDASLAGIACLTGAFRNVRMGAAWWFNDTLCGIRRNLATIAEYSALGNNLGMLTDSRSFSSYSRFDFFRRILCNYVGEKVESGEYDEQAAVKLCENICYFNAKKITEIL